MGHPFLLLGVCNYMMWMSSGPLLDTFDIKMRPRLCRLYSTREKLMFVRKKRSQGNHINKFKIQYPDYEYRELTPSWIPMSEA